MMNVRAFVRPFAEDLNRVEDRNNDAKFFFQHSENKYRYWYRRATEHKEGRLVVQIKAADLEAFRKTLHGRTFGAVVKIRKRKGGWYRITSDDLSDYDEVTGSKHDGLKVWLRAFNAFFNQEPVYKQVAIIVRKERESRNVVPFIRRADGTLGRAQVNPVMVQALMARFGK